MRQRRVVTALAIPLALAFVAASCGSDDSSGDTDTGGETTEATETETTDGEEAAPVTAEEEVDTSVVAETEEAVYGGTVTIGLESEATGLRPWEDSCSAPCYNIMRSIYDPLMERTAEGTFEPFLAESLESNEDFTSGP